ncbi:hypothetical protein N431DRAFT_121199, partial [Stipitochalara longipes BDJ]
RDDLHFSERYLSTPRPELSQDFYIHFEYLVPRTLILILTMSHISASRVAKPKSKHQKPHKTTSRSTTSPSSSPLISLQTYVSNIFFDIFIQDQDDIAEISYKRNWSNHVKEKYCTSQSRASHSHFQSYQDQKQCILSSTNLTSGDGQPFTFNSFHTYIFDNLRTTLTNRQLVSQSFVVEPTEGDGGTTGTVAHILQISAVQGGKEVVANGVGVLQIGWNEENSRREVTMESFVLAFE